MNVVVLAGVDMLDYDEFEDTLELVDTHTINVKLLN